MTEPTPNDLIDLALKAHQSGALVCRVRLDGVGEISLQFAAVPKRSRNENSTPEIDEDELIYASS